MFVQLSKAIAVFSLAAAILIDASLHIIDVASTAVSSACNIIVLGCFTKFQWVFFFD